jgi:hypothetical protein
MAGEVTGARPGFDTAQAFGRDERTPLAEVEIVPGGTGWLVELSEGRGRIWTEWPLPPGVVIRLRSAARMNDEDNTAQILRSELIEVRHGRPPLYEGVLLFSQPRV